jgi:hypothetical protein
MRIPVAMSVATLILVNLVPLADGRFLFRFANVMIGAANLLCKGMRLPCARRWSACPSSRCSVSASARCRALRCSCCW